MSLLPVRSHAFAACAAALAAALVTTAAVGHAREPGAWRHGGGRGGAMEARGAHRVERVQQRALQRGQPRPEPMLVAPPVAGPMPAPWSAPPPLPMSPPPVETAPAERSRPGRLTPDERRALRQQINDAGRDLYRPDRP